MSEKVDPKQITATEFKNHQGSLIKTVIKGARLALTWRGKRVASIEPAQGVLPLEEGLTAEDLQKKLSEGVALVDPQDLESLVGIAKSLNDNSVLVSVSTRSAERAGDLHRDILRVSEKLDLENLEKFVSIVRLYAKDGLKGNRK
jgi:antitoxin (DNA-binding transcriptional repressor) of toxin-antitoxin stability system